MSTQEVKLPLFAHRHIATVDDGNLPVAVKLRQRLNYEIFHTNITGIHKPEVKLIHS
jgi:hypothetical protein